MTVENAHNVLFGKTDIGFIAVSVGAPYFCFEGESEDALDQKVRAALKFYYSHKADDGHRNEPPKNRTLRAFTPLREVPMKQFEAA